MKRIFLSLESGLIGLLLVTLVQSSGIPVSDASTVPPTAIDPTLIHTLQVRYKTLAKQLTQLMPTTCTLQSPPLDDPRPLSY